MDAITFPLYDSLSKMDIVHFDLAQIATQINELSDEKQEVVAALIYHHWVLEAITRQRRGNLPYGAKALASEHTSLLYCMSSLPKELQNIVCLYVCSGV